ncbi:MAG: glycosyltransferase family 4 protein [Burkholderiales bacterium]|nr:glycosyltransferase family 4 protein [Phycisphaerae bacterium]
MTIAYLVNQYPQPSHTFIRREIRELEKLGLQIRRYTLRKSTSRLSDPDDQAEHLQTRAVLSSGAGAMIIAVLSALFTRPGAFFSSLALARRIAKPSGRGLLIHLIYLAEACVLLGWTKRDNIAHVHAHFGTNSTAVAMLLSALGGPGYSFTSHGPEEFDMPVSLSLGEKIRRSAFTVAISGFGRSQLYRWVGHEHWDKIKIVRCGVDAGFLGQLPAPLPATRRLVNIGRLSEQKGQLLLVEAASILQKRGVDFQLDIIGDGELRPQIESMIARHQLQSQVHLLGFKSGAEVRLALDESRVMVLPSFAEGLPVVIMESLSRHRPVIATAVAGIPDLIRTNETGWLISAGDENQLADAMERAINTDDATLAAMGAAGARLVAQNHNAATEAAGLAELFNAVIGRPR